MSRKNKRAYVFFSQYRFRSELMLLKENTQHQISSYLIDTQQTILTDKQQQELDKLKVITANIQMDQFEKADGVLADRKIVPTSLHGNGRPSDEKDREKVN